jgi:hypothetical protein
LGNGGASTWDCEARIRRDVEQRRVTASEEREREREERTRERSFPPFSCKNYSSTFHPYSSVHSSLPVVFLLFGFFYIHLMDEIY